MITPKSHSENRLFLAISIFCIQCLFANGNTEVQMLHIIHEEIREKMDNGIKPEQRILEQKLIPLFDDCMKKSGGDIEQKADGELSILDFLSPKIGSHDNPFFFSCLWRYISGRTFEDSPIDKRRKTLGKLLQMMTDEKYETFHRSIFNSIIMFCFDKELYSGFVSEQINRLAEKTLVEERRDGNVHNLLLLVRLDKSSISPTVLSCLKEEAKKCTHFEVLESKSYPFISTVVLASLGDKDNLKKFLNLMHDNGKFISIDKARYLFPYTILVRKREVVQLLKEYLKSGLEVDNGEDIMHRYEGYARWAATSLFVLLNGFPEPPDDQITKEYREKCIAFLSGEAMNFRKEIDLRNQSNYSISRIRFMLYGF